MCDKAKKKLSQVFAVFRGVQGAFFLKALINISDYLLHLLFPCSICGSVSFFVRQVIWQQEGYNCNIISPCNEYSYDYEDPAKKEDIDLSAVTCVRNNRICDIILQL